MVNVHLDDAFHRRRRLSCVLVFPTALARCSVIRKQNIWLGIRMSKSRMHALPLVLFFVDPVYGPLYSSAYYSSSVGSLDTRTRHARGGGGAHRMVCVPFLIGKVRRRRFFSAAVIVSSLCPRLVFSQYCPPPYPRKAAGPAVGLVPCKKIAPKSRHRSVCCTLLATFFPILSISIPRHSTIPLAGVCLYIRYSVVELVCAPLGRAYLVWS